MARRTDELRLAVGAVLRRLRSQGHFSLDDIQRGTTEQGVRVTRSHLSRVETGQAELSLPRYLALVRVLGEPAGEVTESLAALVGWAGGPAASDVERLALAMQLADPARVAVLFRGLAARCAADLGSEALERWADAEAALGRWTACERVLSIALGPAVPGEPRPLFRLAVAHLGAGRPGLALALARASRTGHACGPAIEASALLESGRSGEVAELFGPLAAAGLSALLVSEARRRQGQPRAALQALRAAAGPAPDALQRAEARVVEARVLADLRRTVPGLRAAHEARALARRLGRPELLARTHVEASRLHRLAGELDQSRGALRAARVLLARAGAERRAPRAVPLQALWATACAAESEGRSPGSSGRRTPHADEATLPPGD